MSNIAVTVNQTSTLVSSIKPTKTVVSSVTIGPKTILSLNNLTDVDATDPDEGETIVYDAGQSKYIVKAITVDSNNVTNINGGSF